MATALTLDQAAGQAFDNLHIRWLANQLGGANGVIATLCRSVLPLFPPDEVGSAPVQNWITIFFATGVQLPAVNVPIDDLTASAEILYRLCWMAFSLIGNGISNAQAATLLANINVIIGF